MASPEAALEVGWPDASTWQAFRALRLVPERSAFAQAMAEAKALEPAAAATRLLTMLPSAWRALPHNEKKHAIGGMGELIRAGADPTAALATLSQAVGAHGEQAGRALRAVVEQGWSLEPILDAIQAAHDEGSDYTRGRLRPAIRLWTIAQRYGPDILADLRAAQARRPSPPMTLIEEALAGDGPQALARAQLTQPPRDSPDDALRALLPFLRESLAQPHLRSFAVGLFGRARGINLSAATLMALQAALPEIADGLREPAVAPASARTIAALLEVGCDATDIRPQVDAALDHDDREVRVALSRALSKWLVAEGLEPPLPAGQSHRRTYARGDTPISPGTRRCPSCDEDATVLIYAHREGGNTWAEDVEERLCPACGLYLVSISGY